jgi:hypothetical protein
MLLNGNAHRRKLQNRLEAGAAKQINQLFGAGRETSISSSVGSRNWPR